VASPLALTDSHSAPARMAETAATLNLDQAMRSDSRAGDDRMAETAVTLNLDQAMRSDLGAPATVLTPGCQGTRARLDQAGIPRGRAGQYVALTRTTRRLEPMTRPRSLMVRKPSRSVTASRTAPGP